MQVVYKASHIGSDVRCRVCGQGFLVYGASSTPEERAQRHQEVARALRADHARDHSTKAHPPSGFVLCEGRDAEASEDAVPGDTGGWAFA